tara:strand:- start:60 stop:1658 length:1599 start_codon:yes stop_codon:yes gene_type:complete
MKECTFKPKITSYKAGGARRTNTSRAGIWERLQNSSATAQESLREEARKVEAKKMEECTFKPSLGPATSQLQRKRLGGRGGTLESCVDRLHHEADMRVARRQQRQRAMQEAELKSYPFRPVLSRETESIVEGDEETDRRPLFQRVHDLQRSKQQALQQLRLSAEQNNKDLSFNPKINQRSEKIIRERIPRERRGIDIEHEPVWDRLAHGGDELLERRMDELLEHNVEFDRKHTFQPELCEKSERIVSAKFSDSGAHPLTFLERQSALERRKQQRQRQSRLMLSAERDCTFHPQVGNTDQILMHVRPQRLAETEDARVERLSTRDAKRNAAKRERAKEAKYAQFKYTPEINQISRLFGKASTVEALHANERNANLKAEAKRKQEKQFRSEHTFKPRLATAKKSKRKSGGPQGDTFFAKPETMMTRLQQQQEARDARLEATRMEQEAQELDACTFQPTMHRSRPKQTEVCACGIGAAASSLLTLLPSFSTSPHRAVLPVRRPPLPLFSCSYPGTGGCARAWEVSRAQRACTTKA